MVVEEVWDSPRPATPSIPQATRSPAGAVLKRKSNWALGSENTGNVTYGIQEARDAEGNVVAEHLATTRHPGGG